MIKIAIVHDWLTNMGGAEKVIEQFLKIFPGAPVYTSMADKQALSPALANADIRPSTLQMLVTPGKPNHMKFLPLMPAAFEGFDLTEYNIVLSSSSSCAKGAVTAPDALHFCYCHTPMRYGWEMFYKYTEDFGIVKNELVKYFMSFLRVWDYASAARVDYFIANSENVAKRIKKHYRRDSKVIYPPVNTEFYTPYDGDKKGEFYLCVSRLVPYKMIDLAVAAFNKNGKNLYVIGDGSESYKLKNSSRKNIKFLGRKDDETVRKYMRGARAFIFPGEEDFGITPVEAQACGTPVIAFGKGGALETVTSRTGVFFNEQSVQSLNAAIENFETKTFSKSDCRANAERFSEEIFRKEIKNFITEKYEKKT
jgi:glycosyltransferase involved in cell wall biosynthesis